MKNIISIGAVQPEVVFGFSSRVAQNASIAGYDSPAVEFVECGQPLVDSEPSYEAAPDDIEAAPNAPTSGDSLCRGSQQVVDANR